MSTASSITDAEHDGAPGTARHARRLEPSAMAPLPALALREPWWDTVDGVASVVGDVLRRARAMQPGAQVVMPD